MKIIRFNFFFCFALAFLVSYQSYPHSWYLLIFKHSLFYSTTVLLKYVSTSLFIYFFYQLSHFISFPDVHKVGREIVATSRLTHRLLISRTLRTVSDIVTKITWVLESLIFFTEYLHFFIGLKFQIYGPSWVLD